MPIQCGFFADQVPNNTRQGILSEPLTDGRPCFPMRGTGLELRLRKIKVAQGGLG